MLDYSKLKELSDPQDLTSAEKGGKCSAESRGLPYYGRLRKNYPVHWISFYCMHHRSTPTDYNRDCEGFIQFIIELGDVPVGMIKPTVGRKDHTIGYVKGNFSWQESSDNSTDAVTRFNKTRTVDSRRRASNKAMASGTNPLSKIVKCPHCDVTSNYATMKRWHFDNCKKNNASVM